MLIWIKLIFLIVPAIFCRSKESRCLPFAGMHALDHPKTQALCLYHLNHPFFSQGGAVLALAPTRDGNKDPSQNRLRMTSYGQTSKNSSGRLYMGWKQRSFAMEAQDDE